jgi:AcrR family transcriptional regulator
LRADARRNREAIIAAARTLFVERGTDVPMEDIARAAGVGVGTLYRRFPDRDYLIGAVAADNFHRVLDGARAVVAESTGAWDALERFLGRTGELKLSLRLTAVSERAFLAVRADPTASYARNALVDLLDDLVHSAQAEGTMRDDVEAGDVVLLIAMTLEPGRFLPPQFPRVAGERYLTLMLDALRAGAGTGAPLPGAPVDIGAFRGRFGEGAGAREAGGEARPESADGSPGGTAPAEG